MSIPFPSIRRPSQVSWALRAQTQAHQSPLDGTMQTLRQPGERWVASVSWPTLVDPDRRVLEAFIAQMGGRAGRFFFGPTHAPRRATGAAGRTNWVANGEWNGAAVGVTPTRWQLIAGPGCTASVAGVGTDVNGRWLDITVSGVPTALLVAALRQVPGDPPTAVPPETWTAAATLQTQGPTTNLDAIRVIMRDVDAAGSYLGGTPSLDFAVPPLAAGTRRSAARLITTPRAGFEVDMVAAVNGAPVAGTLRVREPQLERGPWATPYIATTNGAVTVSSPPVINGAGQAGSTFSTRGWLAGSDAMRAGDFLSYTDTLGRRRLHMVTADAAASGAGFATLSIAPPIRRAGADGAPIEIINPTGVFMLASDEIGVATRPPLFGSVSLEMVEALV